MKRITQSLVTILLAATVFALGGCDLSELNENPNEPTSAEPGDLMTNAQLDFAQLYWRDYAGAYWMRYAQFLTTNQYTTSDRFGFPGSRQSSNNFNFNQAYLILNDLQEIIRQNNSEDVSTSGFGPPANQIAMANIMQAYVFSYLTDQYGPVPYNEAVKGATDGNFSPAYASQEAIYKGMIQSLTQASNNIQPGAATLSGGDLIYGGDMAKWKKFANALKMRLALRISDVAPGTAQTALQEAISAGGFGGKVSFTPAEVPFSSSAPYQNPIFGNYNNGRDDWAAPQSITKILNKTQDPRRPFYFADANAEKPGHQTNGFPYGLKQEKAQALFTNPNKKFSRPSQKVRQPDFPCILMLPDEISFIKAEAMLRSDLDVSGQVSQSVDQVYKNAITSSLTYWGVSSDAAISGFLSRVTLPTDRSGSAEKFVEQKLGVQKWIAQYLQGIQGWSTWRRLDFQGVFQIPPGNPGQGAFGKAIAVRMSYPPDEQTLNGEQLSKAVKNLLGGSGGTDNQGTLLWWDTEYKSPQ